MAEIVMTLDDVRSFLKREFPQIDDEFIVEEIAPMRALLRMPYHERRLRPGGTISGPSMFALADVALYVAILGMIGPVAMAVTTNLNINFLARPAAGDLLGGARLLKLGKRLAVGEVLISPASGGDMVAHAVGSYSIPPEKAVGV